MSYQDARSAADAYKSSSIENAPGIKVIRMLYEGALRFLDRALAVEADDPEFGMWVTRADAIVVELRCSIEPEHAPELSENLSRLYLFAEDQLSHALMERKKEGVEQAKQVLTTLLEAWKAIELQGGAA